MAEQLEQARQPQSNIPILSLNAERGGPGDEPTHQLLLPSSPRPVIFTLLVDPPHQPTYGVTLRDARRREVWRGSDLRADENDFLTLSLPSTMLAPGDYTLSIEGLVPGRKPIPAGRFVFRVLPPT